MGAPVLYKFERLGAPALLIVGGPFSDECIIPFAVFDERLNGERKSKPRR